MTSRVSSSLLTSCAHHAISCLDLYIRASFVYSCINFNQTSEHKVQTKTSGRIRFFYDGIIERCEFMNSCRTSHIHFMIRMFERRSNPPPLYHHLLTMFDIPKYTFLEVSGGVFFSGALNAHPISSCEGHSCQT